MAPKGAKVAAAAAVEEVSRIDVSDVVKLLVVVQWSLLISFVDKGLVVVVGVVMMMMMKISCGGDGGGGGQTKKKKKKF